MLNCFGEFLRSDIRADEITVQMLEQFIIHRRQSRTANRVAKEERLIAPKTIRNEVFVLVDLFHWAKASDYVAHDPTDKLKKPRRVVYDVPRCLSVDEYLRLKAAITDPVFSDVVDFFLLSGVRRGDGKNVTSENFEWEGMRVKFFQGKQGTWKTIPIGRDLFAVAKRMIDRVGEGRPLVDLHVDRLTTDFAEARDRAGLPKSITFHSLRHTFASWLVAIGTDIETVQELVGHSSIESTQLYLHSFSSSKVSAIDKLVLPRAKTA